jgi:biopolymer transport protein ExbD
MRVCRLRKTAAHLEITAFINLIVVLVPFLLSTAVFTRLAVIDLSLPAQSSGVEQLKVDTLRLEVVIRRDALEVGDRIGGLIQRIPDTPSGHDLQALAVLAQQIKTRFPDQTDATVLPEPNTAYDTLVQVMDALRAGRMTQGTTVVRSALFPNISIGDAPVRTRQAGS